MGKYLKLVAKWIFVISLLFTGSQSVSAADDITGHWAEEDMRFLIERDILQGDANGYHPNNPITRGQFAALIARSLELEPFVARTFTDVNSFTNYGYESEVLHAANHGIITGYPDNSFRPNEKISRQHMALIMKRTLNYLGIEGKDPNYQFTDEGSIFPSYRADVYQLAGAGIFKGSKKADGSYRFRPTDQSHRWEAATVLARLIKLAEEEVGKFPVYNPKPQLTYATAYADQDYWNPDPETEYTYQNGNLIVDRKYYSFEEAAAANTGAFVVHAAMLPGQVVVNEASIVKKPDGAYYKEVFTRPSQDGTLLTYVFDHPRDMEDPEKAYTSVSPDTEMEYIEATADYVKVKFSGRTGYIKQENAFMPTSLYVDSYYSVNSEGDLVRTVSYNKEALTSREYVNQEILSKGREFISDYNKQEYLAFDYIVGKAPGEMDMNKRYPSLDQINFRGGKITSYNYYQFISARTKTTYTADELDHYIMEELKRREAIGEVEYTDATVKSKLIGIGSTLKKVEDEKKINALLLLALAQHESNYGMSDQAQEYNNVIGLGIKDINFENHRYESVEENLNSFADEHLNRFYISPNSKYAHGAALGTKAVGLNVKYDSDPYWGAKVAGNAYLIDKTLGGRDHGRYRIGITQSAGLNARTSPNTGDNIAFKYDQKGMPVAIVGEEYNESEDQTWYQILSDDLEHETVWLAEDVIQIVSE